MIDYPDTHTDQHPPQSRRVYTHSDGVKYNCLIYADHAKLKACPNNNYRLIRLEHSGEMLCVHTDTLSETKEIEA